MHALNPFLRAFFRSSLPSQCVPVENHILLVPLTEALVHSRDRESNAQYVDLVNSEEFLASHVLRIPGQPGSSSVKEVSTLRDHKGKAWQIATANGRTVVIKESAVYSNKGFKNVNHAQLISDVLYASPNDSSQQWLIYYISRPLLGSYEPGQIIQAIVPGSLVTSASNPSPSAALIRQPDPESYPAPYPPRNEVSSFSDLLSKFPLIAKQMKPGLDRLFREFGKELGKPLPPPPSESPTIQSDRPSDSGALSRRSSSHSLPFSPADRFEDEEDAMRHALDTAVTAAIDIFRSVDKQQLSFLGATTDLTGPMVERLIERYVLEQVHDSVLFPRLRDCRQSDDLDLDLRVRQMENVDISQVGIPMDGGYRGREEIARRVGAAVEEFRKMSNAKSPQDMLSILLKTVKIVTIDQASTPTANESEKPSVLTINADVLVSLLLLVVIRSHVRHLYARLLYMQRFIFVDDVESGESGYALSTFEGVLVYLQNDSAGLRRASSRNKRLWTATKQGNVTELKAILQPDIQTSSPISEENECGSVRPTTSSSRRSSEHSWATTNGVSRKSILTDFSAPISPTEDDAPETPRLSHVFPFQTWAQPKVTTDRPKARKKVSMDTRSMSESSTMSFLSHSTTLGSIAGGIEGDTSIQNLTMTKDPTGHSVPMMAVEAGQPESLSYLLSLSDYYSRESIFWDVNSDGMTLLSAAVQLAHTEIINIIIEYILRGSESDVSTYLKKSDSRGRTVGHYLFNSPALLSRLGSAIPWTLKDKNGQTPLFALCRSYDHPDYNPMVNEALTLATEAQGDGRPLRLDDHVDGKGNTLLHIVSDPQILLRILRQCDGDPNYTNDKRFTPLMVASKYGRIDLVRTLFADSRVDVHVRESRGLTAVELAKDDDVRNRIDDLVLCSDPPSSPYDATRRTTSVVRSIFVEDFGIRFIIKSGAPSAVTPPSPGSSEGETITYTVTTCRRSISDFENLIYSLRLEHPASYLPQTPTFRSPFQIPSKPSRAVLHDIQERLDRLLKVLLAHPTFSTHELLWEFFLVPEIQTSMVNRRSELKALALAETIWDDYEPASTDVIRDVQQILSHAEDAVQSVSEGTRNLICCGYLLQHASTDFADAIFLCGSMLSSLQPPANALPLCYVHAFQRFAASFNISSTDSSPLVQFMTALTSSQSTTAAMLSSLARPNNLILTLNTSQRALSRARSAVAASSLPRKFNFSVLEESRQRSIREQETKINALTAEIDEVGKEISWNKDVVVGELAGWSSWRERTGRQAIREFVKTTLVREKERARRMERALRLLRG